MQSCHYTKGLVALAALTVFISTALAASATASSPIKPGPSNASISLGATVHGTTVLLTWSGSSGSLPIRHYEIFEGTSPSSLAQIAVTTRTSWEDRGLTPGTTFYFAVAGGGAFSNVVAVTIPTR
jgi:hypothetical protein